MRRSRATLVALVGVLPATHATSAAPIPKLNTSPCAAGSRQRTYDQEIAAATRSVANIWAVPNSLVKAVIQRESGFRRRAVSPAGAIGLMQVLPFNTRRLGLMPAQLWEPGWNILAGTRLLAVLLRHYEGDVISTLVAYNARPRRRLAPIPTNGETPAYVRAVLQAWQRLAQCEK